MKKLKSYLTRIDTYVILAIGGVLALSIGFIGSALAPAANAVKSVTNKVA